MSNRKFDEDNWSSENYWDLEEVTYRTIKSIHKENPELVESIMDEYDSIRDMNEV